MQGAHKNLLLGFIGSAIGFIASFAWYNSTAPDQKVINKSAPIATVQIVEDESRKRPVSRMFWMDINKGDSLYSGEVIETTSQSTLILRFLNSDRLIEIEPNTLLVLQGAKDELSIDLLEGGLFVSASTQAYERIDINSSQGKIDLSKASASVSGTSNGKINLQVLRGEASFRNQNGIVNSIAKGKNIEVGTRGLKDRSAEFSLYYPSLDKAQYVTVGQTENFTFKWETNQNFSSYKLLIGEHRKKLKDHPISEFISNKEFKAELPPGKHYFQIVSTDPNLNFESPLYRIDIKGLKPPTLIYPEASSIINLQTITQQGLKFKWTGTEEFVGITFELATNSQMNPTIFRKEIARTSEQMLKNLSIGNYYVRLTGRSISSGKLISSRVIPFTINNQTKQLFKEPLIITWITPSDDTKIFYPTVKPETNISWNASNLSDVIQWQVRIAPEGSDLQMTPPQTTKVMQLQSQLDRPGRYIAMVEGLNDKNQVIGKSAIRKIEYQPMPLLSTPQINPPNTNLVASEDGTIDINWTRVSDAVNYQISLKDQSGQVQNFKTNSTSYRISKLNPGKYTIDVQAIDDNSRMSPKVKSRLLIVPEPSLMMAPVIKKIQVN